MVRQAVAADAAAPPLVCLVAAVARRADGAARALPDHGVAALAHVVERLRPAARAARRGGAYSCAAAACATRNTPPCGLPEEVLAACRAAALPLDDASAAAALGDLILERFK